MPPFSFFKKKDKDIHVDNERPYFKLKESSPKPDNEITLDFASTELKKIENIMVQNYVNKLKKLFEETIQIYQNINIIAENIENEEIDIEEEKLTPLINNTKNIIVKSLKRETANIPSIPQTFEDFMQFKESLNASINRFGEVTSSHSRVISTFMKKQASNLRSDLKKITENSKNINKYYEDLMSERKIIEECKFNLSDVANQIKEEQNSTNILESVNRNIKKLTDNMAEKEKELKSLKSSSAYSKILDHLKKKELVEKNRKKSIENIKAISTHMTKATHKYSYGISKGTKEKVDNLINDPLKIAMESDILPYLEIIKDLKKSINTNKIILKDSAKVIHYCDLLIEELPRFKDEINETDLKIANLIGDGEDRLMLERVKRLEYELAEIRKNIEMENSRKDEINNQRVQEAERIDLTVKNIEKQLFQICKKKYNVVINT